MSKALKIFRKYDSIKKYKKELDSYNIKSVDELKRNSERFYSSSMILFSMLNDLFSISEEIIDILDLELPENYHQIFSIMRKAKIISVDEEKKCFKLVKLRNVLAHEYDEFKEEDTFDLILDIDFIIELSDRLIEIVKNN